ncbi:MAG: hypothetical protein KZQ76_11860 [Candidatus Thiodiazotropha sp. (ex Epidulcina cf. delphinae)]|nr:hypothetical protein [Candidatus Thiodiazotropha sp. (ex Epidulcina cf. delphinae)]
MNKELADVVDRFEALHDHTMQVMQSQHHLNGVLIAALMKRGAVDLATFLGCLYSALRDLDRQGASATERLFVDFWFDTLNEEPDPPDPGRPGWFRGVILGGKAAGSS